MIMFDSYLPTTASGWIGLATGTLTLSTILIGGVIKFIRTPLINQLNGFGARLSKLEEHVARNTGDLEAKTRLSEMHEFKMTALSERFGMMEGKQSEHEKKYEALALEVTGRMASVEAQLASLTRAIERIIPKSG